MFNSFKKPLDIFKNMRMSSRILIATAVLIILIMCLLNTSLMSLIQSNKWVKSLMAFSGFSTIMISASIILIGLLIIEDNQHSPLSILKVKRIDEADKASRVLEITLINNSYKEIILDIFEVSWLYHKGMCCSIAQGVAIYPIATYQITLPIDVIQCNSIQYKTFDVNPTIVIPPRTSNETSITCFKIQFHYELIGSLQYHPQSDWNIYLTLNLLDTCKRKLCLLEDYKWRTDEDFSRFYNGEEDIYFTS